MQKAQSVTKRPRGKRLLLSMAISILLRRQLFLSWALKDGYDLNKDKDISSLDGQEFEQNHAEIEKYKLPQEKAYSSV